MMKTKYWLYVFVWVLILAILSSDSFSYLATRRVTIGIIHFFDSGASLHSILKFHEIMRKVLHVVNYAALSWLLLCAFVNSFQPTSKWTRKIALLCILCCLFYSVVDEWRQSFSHVRTSRLFDVYLDTGGAILTQLICLLFYTGQKRQRAAQTHAQ
jgi:VanZ family protein